MENNNKKINELLNLIKYPSVTEKSINLYGNRQYTFIVDRNLRKIEIKYILENIFNITITKINTCILPIKQRRVGKFLGKRPQYKKAYIKLKEGQQISDLFN
uniref:Ribosomal protein L23 n=1 Tax=Neotessella volvocina TaxID=52559 RepID=A0A3G2R004_9STRA|nr:ribosomal protein L23 [Neotessella volvocina]